MNFLLSFFNTLLLSCVELLYLLAVIMIIGLILGVMERYSNSYLGRAFGPKAIIATAWIGTPIHEIGHLIQCFIWGHRVTRFKLLQFNNRNGVLGFVEHQYNPGSMYQQVGNFFIGIGPIFSGIGSLILSMYFLVPHSYTAFQSEIHQHMTIDQLDITILKTVAVSVLVICESLFTLENFINPQFWLFLIIAISISSHIALSKADIQGAAKGLVMIFFVLLLFNLVSGMLQLDSYRIIVKLASYNAYVLAFSSITLLFSFITLIVSFLLFKIKERLSH